MQMPVRPPRDDATSFQRGFIATIGTDLTVVSKSGHPSASVGEGRGQPNELPHLAIIW